MRKKIGNETGSVVVGAMIVLGVVTVGYFQVGNYLVKRQRALKSESNDWEAKYSLQSALALTTYMVSKNIIICRNRSTESGWLDGYAGDCRWGGNLTQVSATDVIQAKDYGVKASLSPNNKLRIKFPKGHKMMAAPEISVELEFKVLDMYSSVGLRKMVGKIPDHLRTPVLIDDDTKLVEVHAQVYRYGEIVQTQSYYMRRPVSVPELSVSSFGSCALSCASGMSANPNPECRGGSDSPPEQKAQITMTVKNLGPGVLYQLKYKKVIKYNPSTYPGVANSVGSADIFGSGSMDVILPGATVSYVDEIPCIAPVAVSSLTSVHQDDYVSVNYSLDLADSKMSNVVPHRYLKELPSISTIITPIQLVPPH